MSKIIEVEPEGFLDLWMAWRPYARATDGRGKARPTYRKWLLDGADPQDILDGVRWHLQNPKERDKEFIQLLSVYLNSERWMDECEKWREFQRIQSERAENVVRMEPRPSGQTAFLKAYRNQREA